MEKKNPLALHEPNEEARSRGYLRGAVVRWNGGEGAELGIVIGHDVEGDPMVVFPTHDRSCPDAISMDPAKTRLALLRPAPAPAPSPAVDPELARILRHDCPDPDGPETPIEGARRLVECLRAVQARHAKIAEALDVSPASDLVADARNLSAHARYLEAERSTISGDRSFVLRILEALDVKPGTLSEDQILARLRILSGLQAPAPAPAPARRALTKEKARSAFRAGAEWGASHPEAAADLLDALEREGLE